MLRKVLCACALLVSSMANAGFVSTDWKVASDSYATLHQETGKEWLDLTRTDGMSVNEVMAQLGEGGMFAGWRLPRYDEVIALMTSYTGVNFGGTTTSFSSAGVNGLAMDFINQFGMTHFGGESSNGNWYSYGLHLDEAGNVKVAGTRHQNSFGNRYGYLYAGYSDFYLDFKSTVYGVFLVSDGGTTYSSITNPQLNINNPDAPINSVDVSAPLSLAGAGLMVFGLIRLRKKSN